MPKKRVVIVTDSLGCPRQETTVDQTWVDKVLIHNEKFYYYTFCKHGAHSRSIPKHDVANLNPDIIIVQIGIVDACRRVMSEKVEKMVKKIPGIRGLVHRISKRYHYKLTKLLNIHYSSSDDYRKLFDFFLNNTQAKIIFCAIAPAGEYLRKRVFNIDNDIYQYNSIVRSQINDRLIFMNPWEGKNDFLLDDGHHLNAQGIDLVYNAVVKELNERGDY